MKFCPGCDSTKPFSEFAKHNRRKDGLQIKCKKCKSLVDKEWYSRSKTIRRQINKRNKEKAVLYIRAMKEKPCKDCGKQFHFSAMDFDHVSGDKEFCIAQMSNGFSFERIKKEIDKCEVVCAVCHRIRTYKRSHSDVV